MTERTRQPISLSQQMKNHANKPVKSEKEYDGNFGTVISTGSTLLDLAISGNRIRGGGLPGGVLIEAFGPSQSGKTALLAEIAGHVQRKGGEAQFHDPEARLDHEFTRLFGMDLPKDNYYIPDTVTEVFKMVRSWEPKAAKVIHVILADSLTALSTDLEMGNEEGDKMGSRRAKEFSEELRKTCRIIKKKNYLMVCSNQVRMNMDAAKYAPRFISPGGEALKFYASIRLRFGNPEKIYKVVKIAGKDVKKVIGINTEIEVVKTVDDPYRKATISILYNYGIDDIRQNLQFIKDYTKNTQYTLGDSILSNSMEGAIKVIEDSTEYDLVKDLRNQVIDLWEEIESKFETERKPKH